MWPELPYSAWKETYDTLHMWTQVVGKVALKLNPLVNHWWECSLRVSPRGLRTTPIYFKDLSFQIEFDFIDHDLSVTTSLGRKRVMALSNKSVADFYFELMDCLGSMGVKVAIDPVPKEVPDPIACNVDRTHKTYDRDFAWRHWRILCSTEKVLTKFRANFLGKASPVQFWWGSFDLVVTLFSGLRAPERPNADHITKEAYSHEVYSCGFWPGSGNILEPAFYSYMAPEPERFRMGRIMPLNAYYNEPTHGYILRYEDVRRAPHPEEMLLEFFNSTYSLGASLGGWNRHDLERHPYAAALSGPPEAKSAPGLH